ncbi:uncharacterized protein KGF55_000591 [Candida pseudojiufengensis]|uniref:uncharacterized protein n=1 Tax=Candida pseudojiufengensis TaxID=497109 RepID=UPI002223F8ED|nr:uncharacterized protein KGF55_000591 [Candida pseudojiufengensis]KAI5966282.1 hypothetical protein KGF55_000591 [Candida pseudojiufengensis]
MSVSTTSSNSTDLPIRLPSINELTRNNNQRSSSISAITNSIKSTNTSPISTSFTNQISQTSPRVSSSVGYNNSNTNTSLPSIIQQKEISNNNDTNSNSIQNNFKIPLITSTTPTSNYTFANNSTNSSINNFNKLPSPALPYNNNQDSKQILPPQLPSISHQVNRLNGSIPSPSQLANQHRGSYSSSSSSSSASPIFQIQQQQQQHQQQSPISYPHNHQQTNIRAPISLPPYPSQSNPHQIQQQQPQNILPPPPTTAGSHQLKNSFPEINYRPMNKCHRCGTTETPEWRRGPKGVRTLCNACGLYHAKLVKRKGALLAAEEVLNNKVTKGKNGRRISVKKHNNNLNNGNHGVDRIGMNVYGILPQQHQNQHQHHHQFQPQQQQHPNYNPIPQPPQQQQSNYNPIKFSLPPPIPYNHNTSHPHIIPTFPLIRH